MTETKKKNNSTIWILIVLMLLVIGALLYWNLTQRQELNEIVEHMSIEKEVLQEYYEYPSIHLYGYLYKVILLD